MGYLRLGHCAGPCSWRIHCDVGKTGPKRPRAELLELLFEQREALAASCEGFDKGNQWEANRLATTIYTLLHDGGAITSLLTQLGARSGLRFMSSGRVVDHNEETGRPVGSTPPLVMVQMAPGSTKFVARLGVTSAAPAQIQSSVQFPRWWEKEFIFKDYAGNGSLMLNRRRLVFALRHQDGGAHIGKLTDPAYVRLKEGAGWFGGTSIGSPLSGPMAPHDRCACIDYATGGLGSDRNAQTIGRYSVKLHQTIFAPGTLPMSSALRAFPHRP